MSKNPNRRRRSERRLDRIASEVVGRIPPGGIMPGLDAEGIGHIIGIMDLAGIPVDAGYNDLEELAALSAECWQLTIDGIMAEAPAPPSEGGALALVAEIYALKAQSALAGTELDAASVIDLAGMAMHAGAPDKEAARQLITAALDLGRVWRQYEADG